MSSPDNIQVMLQLSAASQNAVVIGFFGNLAVLDDNVNRPIEIQVLQLRIELALGTMSRVETASEENKSC